MGPPSFDLDRKRTQDALAEVRASKKRLAPAEFNDLKQRLEGLPVQVRERGLALTAAELLRSGEEDRRARPDTEIARWLARWLLNACPSRPLGNHVEFTGPALLLALETADGAQWRAASREAIEFLARAKTFAGALAERQRDEQEAAR